jgi:hypothetical protein
MVFKARTQLVPEYISGLFQLKSSVTIAESPEVLRVLRIDNQTKGTTIQWCNTLLYMCMCKNPSTCKQVARPVRIITGYG